MADIRPLRVAFCSLILQAKGSVVSNFVAWLDLKVAEYKVYGHMILTDDKEAEVGACQLSVTTDPACWPKSCVVSSLLKNGRSAKISNTFISSLDEGSTAISEGTVPFSHDVLSSDNMEIGNEGNLSSTSSDEQKLFSIPYHHTNQENNLENNLNNLATDDKDSSLLQNISVKVEPGTEMPESPSDEGGASVDVPNSLPEASEKMWLSKSTESSVFPVMLNFSGALVSNSSDPATHQSSCPGYSVDVIQRPSQQSLLPARHSHPSSSQAQGSQTLPMQPSTSRALMTFNDKGKQRDQAILLQGIAAPAAPIAGGSAAAPRQQPISLNTGDAEPFQFVYHPDRAGMAKLKMPRNATATSTVTVQRPILPKPLGLNPSVYSTLVLVPSTSQKKKADEDTSHVKKTATVVHCKQCGEDRSNSPHKQYMGSRYCGTTNSTPFEVWRRYLQAARVSRKKKNEERAENK